MENGQLKTIYRENGFESAETAAAPVADMVPIQDQGQAEPSQQVGLFDDFIAGPQTGAAPVHEKTHTAREVSAQAERAGDKQTPDSLGAQKQPNAPPEQGDKRIYRHTQTVTRQAESKAERNEQHAAAHKRENPFQNLKKSYIETQEQNIARDVKTLAERKHTAQQPKVVHTIPHTMPDHKQQNKLPKQMWAAHAAPRMEQKPEPQSQPGIAAPTSIAPPPMAALPTQAPVSSPAQDQAVTPTGKRIFRASAAPAPRPAAPVVDYAATHNPKNANRNTRTPESPAVSVQAFHVPEREDKEAKDFANKVKRQQSKREEKSVSYVVLVCCVAAMTLLAGVTAVRQSHQANVAVQGVEPEKGSAGVETGQGDSILPRENRLYEEDGITYLAIEGHDMIVVNKQYPLPETYGKGVDAQAQAAFDSMAQAAENDGLTIYIVSGYRSYETQSYIYNRNVSFYGEEEANSFSAKPGQSEHQTGLAFDVAGGSDSSAILTNSFKNTPEYAWLVEHAAEYGFILRYPEGKMASTGYIYEPWHFRYVGPELAEMITDSGLTIEEYIDAIQ